MQSTEHFFWFPRNLSSSINTSVHGAGSSWYYSITYVGSIIWNFYKHALPRIILLAFVISSSHYCAVLIRKSNFPNHSTAVEHGNCKKKFNFQFSNSISVVRAGIVLSKSVNERKYTWWVLVYGRRIISSVFVNRGYNDQNANTKLYI